MSTNTIFCTSCGEANLQLNSTCSKCGLPLKQATQRLPVAAPYQAMAPVLPGAEKKTAAGICGILLGALGVHKFILGYSAQGAIMLITSLIGAFLCGFVPTLIMAAIGLVEGILYLTKSDSEFVNTYIAKKKGWF